MTKRSSHLMFVVMIFSCLLVVLSACNIGNRCTDNGSAPPPFKVAVQAGNGMVYLGTNHEGGNENKPDVYALDAHTGKLRWSAQTNGLTHFAIGKQALYVQGSQSCALDINDGMPLISLGSCQNFLLQDYVLYVLQGAGMIVALDTRDNDKVLWHTNVKMSNFNNLNIDNGTLYASSLSGITAFRASDGTQLWNFVQQMDLSKDVFQPAIAGYNIAFFTVGTPTGTFVYALRASDGSVLWRYQKPYVFNVVVGPDDTIYINSGQSDLGVTTLEALRATDGTHLWTDSNTVVAHSPFATKGAFYFEDSTGNYALRSSDGKQLWKTAQEYVVVGMTANALYVWIDTNTFASLNTSNGSIRWQINMVDGVGGFSLSNGIVYLATINSAGCGSPTIPGVIALKESTGQQFWQFQAS